MQAEYDTISADAKKAIEEMQMEDTTEKPADTAETPPKEETPPSGGAEASPSTSDDAPFSVGDAEIERAVKCGMSIADARAFKDKDAFDRICTMLEARGGGDKTISKGSEEKPKGGDDDSADFDVPEITEDEEFDPKLVKLGSVVRKMGDALKAMREENKSLRAAIGKSEEEKAKAKGEAEKAAALEKRKSLHIAQPGGVRGQRREKTDDDIMAEVADDIASKFNI